MPTRSQGGYSFHMAVDPASPGDGVDDIIYFGTVSQARSTDSGVSFSGVGVFHADTHSWAFVPQASPNPRSFTAGTMAVSMCPSTAARPGIPLVVAACKPAYSLTLISSRTQRAASS